MFVALGACSCGDRQQGKGQNKCKKSSNQGAQAHQRRRMDKISLFCVNEQRKDKDTNSANHAHQGIAFRAGLETPIPQAAANTAKFHVYAEGKQQNRGTADQYTGGTGENLQQQQG